MISADKTAAADLHKASLRTRLMWHVLLPLALTWLLGTLVSTWVANHFTQHAFDRALLDDAFAVAKQVRLKDDSLDLMLSNNEVRAVLFDQAEEVFFAIRMPDGHLVAGHAGLRMELPSDLDSSYYFGNIQHQGQKLRAVRVQVQHPQRFDVIMAQSTRSHSVLLKKLLLYSIVPEILLLMSLAVWLLCAIRQDLQPLDTLQSALDTRDANDLTPLQIESRSRDVHRLHQALNALLARLAHSVSAQREFASNVAHELRTPLAAIRALAEYGLAQKDPEAWRTQLQRIAKSQERASHLIDQLLALALADEAQTQLRKEPVALHNLVRDVVLRFLPRADAAGFDLGGMGLDNPLHVMSQPTLIEGMLNNLLDNALRYTMPAQNHPRTLTVMLARESEGKVRLSVIDNGPGIAPEERSRLVQRGMQGPGAGWLGYGAGLGLAIVSRYAQLLGAQLELNTATAQGGLAASIVLPAHDVLATHGGVARVALPPTLAE
jgi:two-component system sensor histidine kinase TctE